MLRHVHHYDINPPGKSTSGHNKSFATERSGGIKIQTGREHGNGRNEPSWPSCRTSCFAPTGRSSGPPGRLASRHARARTRSSCARMEQAPHNQHSLIRGAFGTQTDTRTSTILVSSSSCCTRIIASACRGSWYFCRYEVISAKLIADGFEKDVWGILAVKSSRTFVSSENAGRTGYSWSVIITASRIRLHVNWGIPTDINCDVTCELLRPTSVVHMRSIVVLLHALPLSLWCTLCYRLREECQELSDRSTLVE